MKKRHQFLIFFAALSVTIFAVKAEHNAKPSQISIDEKHGTLKKGVLHVTVHQAERLLNSNPNIKILDVRTLKEYDQGHIKDAIQIDYYGSDFKQKIYALDKDVTWLIHCKSGNRSGRSLPLMKSAGFKSIIHMDGGFDAWKKAQLPVSIKTQTTTR